MLRRRNLVCLPLIVILPVSLLADESVGAMLYSNGVGVFVNKSAAPASIAILPHDLIETQKETSPWLDSAGTRVDISPETMVTYESAELVLDHGSLSVKTSRGLKVRVGCITVTPVNDAELTDYRVVDVDGKVEVSAFKSDVYINERSKNPEQAKQSEHSGHTLVREGESKSRSEKCGASDLKESLKVPGYGPILNSPYTVAVGAAAVIGVTCWVLCFKNDDPLSPAKP